MSERGELVRSYRGMGARRGGPQEVWVYEGEEKKEELPHVVYHSPDGFQWGYGGSGPADLARSLLLFHLPGWCVDIAERLYQQFKWDKIVTFGNTFILTVEEVNDWLLGLVGDDASMIACPLDYRQVVRLRKWLAEEGVELSEFPVTEPGRRVGPQVPSLAVDVGAASPGKPGVELEQDG